jgi:hypothetical protein
VEGSSRRQRIEVNDPYVKDASMAAFIISFRIGPSGNHAERYEMVVQAVRSEATDEAIWEETPSFFVMQSDKTTTALADAISYAAGLLADVDKLLVVNLSEQTYAAKGNIVYPNTLDALLQP